MTDFLIAGLQQTRVSEQQQSLFESFYKAKGSVACI